MRVNIGRGVALVSLSLIFVIGFASISNIGMSQAFGQSFIVVTTDKTSYSEGETVLITGEVSQLQEGYNILSLTLVAPNGDLVSIEQLAVGNDKKFSTSISVGGSLMKDEGTYTVTVQYGVNKNNLATTSFEYGGSTIQQPTPVPFDDVAPLILTPSDLTVYTTYSSALVDFMVKAIDNRDGILRPNCSPSSGSLFSVGETTVTCSAIDNSGNSDRKSFIITVRAPDVVIPSWIRSVASFWCDDEIDDNSFIEAIQYLVTNNVIVVSATVSSSSDAQEIPSWIKSNACWWSQELISDKEFTSGLQYLIEHGIIHVILTSEPSFETDVFSDQSVKPYEIAIVGDDSCKTKTNQALDLLRNNAGIHYEVVTYHVGVIECVDKGSGIEVWATPPRFRAGEITVDGGTIWYAGTIVHDSCHSKLYSDYLKKNPQTGFVPSNIYSGKDAEAQCLVVQHNALVLLGAPQTTLDTVENALESEYWKIPYEDRWW